MARGCDIHIRLGAQGGVALEKFSRHARERLEDEKLETEHGPGKVGCVSITHHITLGARAPIKLKDS